MEAFELLKCKGAKVLFETLLRFRGRHFTINELSKTAKLPFTTTWKLVQKFEKANIIDIELIGRSRVIRYEESEFSNLLMEILRISISPQRLSIKDIRQILKKKGQVKSAYVFGSVALGGEKLESDVDVALLLKKNLDLHPLISGIHEKYRVNVVPLTFDDHDEFEDFLKDKKKVRII